MQEIESRFMTTTVAKVDPPLDAAAFLAARTVGRSANGSIEDFSALERFMAEAAGMAIPDDRDGAYARYCEWWELESARRAFVAAATADFGGSADIARSASR
jgi:molybdate-binding protein